VGGPARSALCDGAGLGCLARVPSSSSAWAGSSWGCVSAVYARNASSYGEILTRIEQIENLRDGQDSPEGEHRGLGSRGVDGKAARVAGLERELKNQ